MEQYAAERAENRPTTIIVTQAEPNRRSYEDMIMAPVNTEMGETTTPNMDTTPEHSTTTSPRERNYMEGGLLYVPTIQQGSRSTSRRGSQNRYITSTTPPSSEADSSFLESNHDANSRQNDGSDLGHYTDASSPAYCHDQLPHRGYGSPSQQGFIYQAPVQAELRASPDDGPIVRLGTCVADHGVNDHFLHNEVATGHVPPQPHDGHADFDEDITFMKSESGMQDLPQHTNHSEGAMADISPPPIGNIAKGGRGVQLNGSVLLAPPAGASSRGLGAPKAVGSHKKDKPSLSTHPSPAASEGSLQSQSHWQKQKEDLPLREMEASPSGDLKRVAVDRSDFHTPKRIRAGGGQDESNDLGDDSDSNLQTWACPFFRHDPLGNMDCLKLRLKRIRDVKQHIQRRHNKSGNYCPKCLRSFASRKKKDEHLNADTCELNDQSASSSKGVLSSEAQEKLKHRALRSKTGDEQWHDVYNIVFKGQIGPDRSNLEPQLGTVIMETTRLMQSFWKNENDWFPEYLGRQHHAMTSSHGDLQVLIDDLMGEIYRRFEERISGSGSPRRSENSAAPTLEMPPSTSPLPNAEPAVTTVPQITIGAGDHLKNEMRDRPSSIEDLDDVLLDDLIDPDLELADFDVDG